MTDTEDQYRPIRAVYEHATTPKQLSKSAKIQVNDLLDDLELHLANEDELSENGTGD